MTTIIEAIDDPALLGGAIRSPSTFTAWRALLMALYGLPMGDDEAAIFRACTGLEDQPTSAFAVLWLICGRRGGKSYTMALIATFMAVFKDWNPFLSKGERAVVLIVAADQKQARIIRNYVGGILEMPMFAPLVERQTADEIELRGRVVIEVATCSYRTVRGRSVCVALLDEVAFWRSEDTVNPDKEVWRSIRASMAQFGSHGVAIIGSSPYAKKGLLYEGYRKNFGRVNDRHLVWQAGTKVMNPTVPDDFLVEEFEEDPASAEAEYNARFRDDVEDFIGEEIVARCTLANHAELPPQRERTYYGFVDAASGSGGDSMTAAIGYREGDIAVVVKVLEKRPKFDPETAVAEFAEAFREYGITAVVGDRWAIGFVEAAFRRQGITYTAEAKPKSDLYRELATMMNAKKVRFVDDKRLHQQLLGLERRTARGGHDSIDHAPGGHDDVANAVAGLVATKLMRRGIKTGIYFGDPAYDLTLIDGEEVTMLCYAHDPIGQDLFEQVLSENEDPYNERWLFR